MTTLKIGGEKRTLPQWGCESAMLTFNSFAADEFSFSTPKLGFRNAWRDAETRVEVFDGGTRIFAGFLQEPTVGKSANGDSVNLSAKGFWDVFESTPYQNSWFPPILIDNIPNVRDLTKVQLFGKKTEYWWSSTGGPIQYGEPQYESWSAEQFFKNDVLAAFAKTDNAALFDIPESGIDFDSQLLLPYEEKESPMFADIFSSIAKWHPELMSAFDYSADKPTLSIKAAQKCAVVSVPVGICTDISLTKDIKRKRRVILRLVKNKTGNTTGGTGSWLHYKGFDDCADEGVSANQRNVVVVSIDISDDNFSNKAVDAQGLLAQLKSIVNRDKYTGSVALFDRNLRMRYAGKRLNIADSRDNLAGIDAQVQSESIDLATGTRTLTLGNDNQPDCEDFVSRIEWLISR